MEDLKVFNVVNVNVEELKSKLFEVERSFLSFGVTGISAMQEMVLENAKIFDSYVGFDLIGFDRVYYREIYDYLGECYDNIDSYKLIGMFMGLRHFVEESLICESDICLQKREILYSLFNEYLETYRVE